MPKLDWDCFACSQPNISDANNCVNCGKPYISGQDRLAKNINRKKIKTEHDFYWTVLKNDFLIILRFISRVFNNKTYTGLMNVTLVISAWIAWEYFNNREVLFAHFHVIVLACVFLIIAWSSLFIEKAKTSERRKKLDRHVDIEIAERKREIVKNKGSNEPSL